MSIQTIAVLDLGDTLTIYGLDTMLTLSNVCVNLIKDSITSELIGILVSSIII